MRLYVVTIGEYDDYRIDKIFLDEEKAKNHNEGRQTSLFGNINVHFLILQKCQK